MRAEATAQTGHGRQYMIQLAKHWSHKFPVAYDDAQASIDLPLGQCRMMAGADAITVTVEAASPTGLSTLQDVVAKHLLRFAFREPELALDWRSA